MEFEVRNVLPVEPAVAWAGLFDPAYEAALLARQDDANREVLEWGERDGQRTRRVQVVGNKTLPTWLSKMSGIDHFGYDQDEVFDDEDLIMHWSIFPHALEDRISAAGTWALLPHPDGCERLVKGQISVAIPVVGGKIEKFISHHLTETYERTTEFTCQWLTENT